MGLLTSAKFRMPQNHKKAQSIDTNFFVIKVLINIINNTVTA